MHLKIHEMNGDGTGSLNIRSSQHLSVNQTTSFFKTELLGHVNSSVELPQNFNCHTVDVVLRGQVNSIEKVTIGPQCMFSLESNEDLYVIMRKLVIQTDGEIKFMAKNGEVEMEGMSLDIRGGAKVRFVMFGGDRLEKNPEKLEKQNKMVWKV